MGRLIILDTSVLVDHLRGRLPARQTLQQGMTEDARPAAPVLTKIEMLRGMRSAERPVIRRLLAALEWIPVSDEIAETAGQFARRYRNSHHTIEVPDYLITATAHRFDAELWTCNVRHFPMFPGLTAPYRPPARMATSLVNTAITLG